MQHESTNDPLALESISSPEGGTEKEKILQGENGSAQALPENAGTVTENQAAGPEAGSELPELIANLLADPDLLEDHVKNAKPHELIFLLENLSQVGDEFENVLDLGKLIQKYIGELKDSENGIMDKAMSSRYQTAWAKFNKRRSVWMRAREDQRAENSKLKKAMLDELKKIVEAKDVEAIQKVRDIQKRWRETGFVLSDDVEALKIKYSTYLDSFYHFRSMSNDLRDRDREQNLIEKQRLVAEASALFPVEGETPPDNWKEIGNKLQELHEEWKTYGLIPRESDEINEQFRSVLDRFYLKRQEYYEQIDKTRAENGANKQTLLEKFSTYAAFTADKAKDWNKATQEVLAMQEEWKVIGPGPKDLNKQLWKDFRKSCDTFFSGKSKFFKKFDDARTENLELKKVLCDKAEALKESTDWKKGAEELKLLQSEWKKIGSVHERHSNKIWKRFRAACDDFFNRRDEAVGGTRAQEKENLTKKEGLITKVKEILSNIPAKDEVREFITAMQKEWEAIGHVPFAEKDRIHSAFRTTLQKLAKDGGLGNDVFGGMRGAPRYNRGGGGGGGSESNRRDDGKDEIQRLRQKMEGIQETLSSYEANIQMISKGKSGDSLRKQIQEMIDAEKSKLDSMKARIKSIRELAQKEKEEKEAESVAAQSPTPPVSPEGSES